MELYIVRHGTTAWNAKGMIQGRSDTQPDDLGITMARQTAETLADKGISFVKVFSSPLQRALITAKTVAPYADIITDERLSELAFGRLEGRITHEMTADPKCAFRYFKADPAMYDLEIKKLQKEDPTAGYESLTDLCKRAGEFLREKIEPLAESMQKDDKILISGHGAVNRGLMMHITGQTDLSRFWGNGLSSNCAMIKISCTPRDSGISYDVQDEDLIFSDRALLDRVTKLL